MSLKELALSSSVSQLIAEEHERPNAKFDVSKIVIIDETNQRLNWNVVRAALKMNLEMTIVGASNITIELEDPQFSFLNDPIFANWMFKEEEVSTSSGRTYQVRKVTNSKKQAKAAEETEREWVLPQRPIDLNVDGIYFRLCAFKLHETKLSLVFEDRIAAELREEKGKLISVNRGDMTRAEFIKHLCVIAEQEKHRRKVALPKGKKLYIPTWIPEAGIVQEVEESTFTGQPTGTSKTIMGTLSSTSGVTIDGAPATQFELKRLNEALEVSVELKAGYKARVALIETLINEGDLASEVPTGPFGITGSSQYVKNNNNIKEGAQAFLTTGFAPGITGAIALEKENPHLSAANIAQSIEVSSAGAASNGEANFGLHREEAETIVKKFSTTAKGETEGTAASEGPYAFTRGPNETSWDCMQRQASEVLWYCFVKNNQLWYVSGNYLLDQLSRYTVERGKDGVDWVNPDIDLGARDNTVECEVLGRTNLWTIMPGNCVRCVRVGPASTTWVVSKFQQDILDHTNAIKVDLVKPLPARKEPASSTTPLSASELGEGEGARGASHGTALAAFYAANTLSELGLPYVYGGGHPNFIAEVDEKKGLDCSSSTSWVLHEAGMFGKEAWDSGEIAERWGESGEGKEMTVWANASHVFIEFNIPGHGRAQMNTNGPKLNGGHLYTLSQEPTYDMTPITEGYTPRHWPGT